jgi:hypothetical protein
MFCAVDSMVDCALASSRLLEVTRNWPVLSVAIGTVLASTLIVVAEGPEAHSSVASQSQSLMNAAYAPLSNSARSALDVRFVALRSSEFATVRVTAPDAVSTAEVGLDPMPSGTNVSVSLGGLTDKEEIVHDWIGTKSWIPKAIPAYVITMSGLHVQSLGPGGAFNPEEIVVVNANSGNVVETVSYR